MPKRSQDTSSSSARSSSPTNDESPKFRAASAEQRHALKSIKNEDVTLLLGPAGSGKTLCAAYAGYQLLKSEDSPIDRIVVVRLAIDTFGEHIGALPGDVDEKLSYLMAPIQDNLEQFVPRGEIAYLFEKGVISVIPVSHARGRSFQNTYLILEEIQNLDFHMLVTLLTRLGRGSKIVLTGDGSQLDIPGRCGVQHAIGLLSGLPGVGVHQFTTEEIYRHPLVKHIVERAKTYRPLAG